MWYCVPCRPMGFHMEITTSLTTVYHYLSILSVEVSQISLYREKNPAPNGSQELCQFGFDFRLFSNSQDHSCDQCNCKSEVGYGYWGKITPNRIGMHHLQPWNLKGQQSACSPQRAWHYALFRLFCQTPFWPPVSVEIYYLKMSCHWLSWIHKLQKLLITHGDHATLVLNWEP